MTDKMREGFETWYATECTCGEDSMKEFLWEAWKASRDSVEPMIKDAMRYRWIKKQQDDLESDLSMSKYNGNFLEWELWDVDLDIEIDKAITAEK